MSNKYRKLIKLLLKAAKALSIKKYSSKFSKRIFTNTQLLMLLVMKQHEKKSYRDFIDWLAFSKLRELMSLKRIPHFTTLQKFSARAENFWINSLIEKLAKKCKLVIAGIDSTGFSIEQKSFYYCIKLGSKPVKGFVKLSIIADMLSKIISAVRVRKKSRHDTIDFCPLLSKVSCSAIVADRAYDSEKNHCFAESKGVRLISPPRNRNVPVWRTSGFHRKALKRKFPFELYSKRNNCESIFSSVKRKFGSFLSSRKFFTQKIELLCRLCAYNAHRIVSIFCIYLRISTEPHAEIIYAFI